MGELFELDLARMSQSISAGQVSPTELVASILERVAKCEPFISAFAEIWADDAMESAKRAEQQIRTSGPVSPLHGIPVALKDLYDVAGRRTGCGSRVMEGHVANADSWMTTRLEALGAVLVGKTQTHEFAFGVMTPRSRNPWSTEHSPGGSSGGSGAAVASGEIPLAFGTDTGGSIRGPATHCGVVGLKPTFGVLPTTGIVPCSWSLDHSGPIARRVGDVRLAYDTLLNSTPPDDAPGEYRIGVPTNYFFERVHPDVTEAVLTALTRITSDHVRLVEIEVPDPDLYLSILFGIAVPEIGAFHERLLRTSRHLYGADVLPVIDAGTRFPARLYIDSLRARESIRRHWLDLFRAERLHAVAAPTHPATAPLQGTSHIHWPDGIAEPVNEAYSRLTCPANITGFPAISVPCGSDRAGLPIGMQIIGLPNTEPLIIDIAELVEETSNRVDLLPVNPDPLRRSA